MGPLEPRPSPRPERLATSMNLLTVLPGVAVGTFLWGLVVGRKARKAAPCPVPVRVSRQRKGRPR